MKEGTQPDRGIPRRRPSAVKSGTDQKLTLFKGADEVSLLNLSHIVPSGINRDGKKIPMPNQLLTGMLTKRRQRQAKNKEEQEKR